MKTFYINPATNDLQFDGANNFKMVSGDDELIQSVRLTIATNLGEWFLNPEHGFNRSVVQGKNVDYGIITETLYAAILQESRVSSVENIEFDFDAATRKLKVNFLFTKTDGGTVEGVFNA